MWSYIPATVTSRLSPARSRSPGGMATRPGRADGPRGGPVSPAAHPRQWMVTASLEGRRSPSMGRVVGLFVGTMPGDPMTSVAEVTGVAGKGLDGDRYAEGRGTFSST